MRAMLGVNEHQAASTLNTALAGSDAIYLHTGQDRKPLPVRLVLPLPEQTHPQDLGAIKVRAQSGALIPLANIMQTETMPIDKAIHHKDLLPVVYVTGDMAGTLDSPLYGLFELRDQLPAGIQEYFIQQPDYPTQFSLKWDGEWQITYETFRDMGAAYSTPLIIMAPSPPPPP
jgi:multidrug efflux pump subunit AcrB